MRVGILFVGGGSTTTPNFSFYTQSSSMCHLILIFPVPSVYFWHQPLKKTKEKIPTISKIAKFREKICKWKRIFFCWQKRADGNACAPSQGCHKNCLCFNSFVIFLGRLSGAHQYRLPSLASWTGRSGHGQAGHTDVRQPTKSHCFVVWPAPVRPAIHCRSTWECSEGQAGLPQTNGQQSGLSGRRIQGPFAANCLHSSEAPSGKIFWKYSGDLKSRLVWILNGH